MDEDIRRMADSLGGIVAEFQAERWFVAQSELDQMELHLHRLREVAETLLFQIAGQRDAIGSIDTE